MGRQNQRRVAQTNRVIVATIAVLMFSAALPVAARAQSPSADDETAGMANGRAWAHMKDAYPKAMYIRCVMDGKDNCIAPLADTRYKVSSEEDLRKLEADVGKTNIQILGASYAEIVAVVGAFYNDAANARVLIIMALGWAKLKIEGAQPTQLDKVAAGLRAASARRISAMRAEEEVLR